jgi:hypothetical protein
MGSGAPPDAPGRDDVLLILGKAVLNFVPLAGGPAAELLDLLRLPAAKRQYAYLGGLAVRLRQLESEKRLSIEDVVQSDAFVSATLRGIDAARRTAEQEKIDALRNGVLNVALGQSVDESLTQLFLDWIDRFTVQHLRLLRAVDDPPVWSKTHSIVYAPRATGPVSDFLPMAFPDLAARQDFLDLMWTDLFQSGLLIFPAADMHYRSSDHGMWPSCTTDIGKAFLRFIEDPS